MANIGQFLNPLCISGGEGLQWACALISKESSNYKPKTLMQFKNIFSSALQRLQNQTKVIISVPFGQLLKEKPITVITR